jgi:hypothetical protein
VITVVDQEELSVMSVREKVRLLVADVMVMVPNLVRIVDHSIIVMD